MAIYRSQQGLSAIMNELRSAKKRKKRVKIGAGLIEFGKITKIDKQAGTSR